MIVDKVVEDTFLDSLSYLRLQDPCDVSDLEWGPTIFSLNAALASVTPAEPQKPSHAGMWNWMFD